MRGITPRNKERKIKEQVKDNNREYIYMWMTIISMINYAVNETLINCYR
jgi:hypothetical protein